MNSKMYIAIIGDIVGSRNLENRDKVQLQLEKTLNFINTTFSEFIESNFTITIGDEFQGLVNRNFPLQKYFQFFKQIFNTEFNIRFGFGLGSLSTALRNEALGMDGPSFHNARAALEIAREKSKLLVFHGFEMNTALNSLMNFTSNVENNWTRRQREVILLIQEKNDQTKVAELLNVSKQSISKTILAAHYDLFLGGWKGIQELFSFSKSK